MDTNTEEIIILEQNEKLSNTVYITDLNLIDSINAIKNQLVFLNYCILFLIATIAFSIM